MERAKQIRPTSADKPRMARRFSRGIRATTSPPTKGITTRAISTYLSRVSICQTLAPHHAFAISTGVSHPSDVLLHIGQPHPPYQRHHHHSHHHTQGVVVHLPCLDIA